MPRARKPARKISAQDREDFERFLFEMDDALVELARWVAPRGIQLDHSWASVDRLEPLLLEPQPQEATALLQNRVARYLGEVFRKQYGGKWRLCDSPPRNALFGLPVIEDFSDTPAQFCPHAVVSNRVNGGPSGLLASAAQAHAPFVRRPSKG